MELMKNAAFYPPFRSFFKWVLCNHPLSVPNSANSTQIASYFERKRRRQSCYSLGINFCDCVCDLRALRFYRNFVRHKVSAFNVLCKLLHIRFLPTPFFLSFYFTVSISTNSRVYLFVSVYLLPAKIYTQ